MQDVIKKSIEQLNEVLTKDKKLVIKKHLIPTYSHFKIVRDEAITEYKPFPKETLFTLDPSLFIT